MNLSKHYEMLFENNKQLPGGVGSIAEHLETLRILCSVCTTAAEIGVEEVVSTYAIAQGLSENSSENKKIITYDIQNITTHPRWKVLKKISEEENINLKFELGDSLKSNIEIEIDLLFIDGWHVYGQVIRELKKFSPKVRKIICLHDTTVDGELGETIRARWDAEKQSRETGIPVNEINKGIWYAVEDFLKCNPDWLLYKRFHNNNGFTILVKNNDKLINKLNNLLK